MTAAGTVEATLAEIADVIATRRYRYARETELHRGIEETLLGAGYSPIPEYRADAKSRLDFLLDGIAIEVKIKGTADALMAQCLRYAALDEVHGILVVTTRHDHRRLPFTLNGKPVRVLLIGGVA